MACGGCARRRAKMQSVFERLKAAAKFVKTGDPRTVLGYHKHTGEPPGSMGTYPTDISPQAVVERMKQRGVRVVRHR